MNWEGEGIALGVIVDGEVLEEGDVGRGARYNSINNYVNQKSHEERYLGIVVSEDGDITFVGNMIRER